jgi:hypothetical protein
VLFSKEEIFLLAATPDSMPVVTDRMFSDPFPDSEMQE